MDHKIQLLKALSDEMRLKIIDLLLHHDYCVGALAHHLGVSEPSISQHLKVLRTVGVVVGEKRGYYTHYVINRERIKKTANILMGIATEPCMRKGCKFELSGGDHTQCRAYSQKHVEQVMKKNIRNKGLS